MSENNRRRHTPQQIVEKLKQADRLLNAGQQLGQVLQSLESASKHTTAGATSMAA
jgi:DNA-binding transcriptional MerR regulator